MKEAMSDPPTRYTDEFRHPDDTEIVSELRQICKFYMDYVNTRWCPHCNREWFSSPMSPDCCPPCYKERHG